MVSPVVTEEQIVGKATHLINQNLLDYTYIIRLIADELIIDKQTVNVDVTHSYPGFVVRHFTDLIFQFTFLMLELRHQTGNVLLRDTDR